MSCHEMSLRDLIRFLQGEVAKGGPTSGATADVTKRLAELGYPYEHTKFPPLVNTTKFSSGAGGSPSSLAEALLWKIGKWNDYKKFVSQYANDASVPGKTDIVFFAFARHLKSPSDRPIYDQHALRAMWAICKTFTPKDLALCESFLMSAGRRKKGSTTSRSDKKWKQTGNGRTAAECYEIFLKHLPDLKRGATNREIDLVLMPLGQAIKKETGNYAAFASMCGWRL